MIIDRLGQVWAADNNNLYTLDTLLNLKFKYTDKTLGHVNGLYPDETDGLWLATENGLMFFDTREKKLKDYTKLPNSLKNKLKDVHFIFQGSGNDTWIGTQSSLLRYTSNTKKLDEVRLKSVSPQSIYSCMVRDQASILWIGTNNGLIKYDLKTPKFQLYNSDNLALTSQDIASVFKDDQNRLWIGTWGEGLNIFLA
ncbi:MAG: hypothetical protein HC896_12495 [Bacteroidales bacterium]|nr:hypothetical protein [Bacteroidales bacterium]